MPGDLNLKKSWNPALMKNQKKVWEREQEALKEFQTIKQRQKEIAAEREKEEMIRLQYGSDPSSMPTKDKLELNKLGWMYQGGPQKSDDKDDSGSGFREIEEDFLAKSDDIQQLLRGSKAMKTSMGSRFDKVSAVGAQRSSSALSDDPLLMMKSNHLRQKREIRDQKDHRDQRDRDRRDSRDHRSNRDHRDRSPTSWSKRDAGRSSGQSYRDRRENGENHTTSKDTRSRYRENYRDSRDSRDSQRDQNSYQERHRRNYRDEWSNERSGSDSKSRPLSTDQSFSECRPEKGNSGRNSDTAASRAHNSRILRY